MLCQYAMFNLENLALEIEFAYIYRTDTYNYKHFLIKLVHRLRLERIERKSETELI